MDSGHRISDSELCEAPQIWILDRLLQTLERRININSLGADKTISFPVHDTKRKNVTQSNNTSLKKIKAVGIMIKCFQERPIKKLLFLNRINSIWTAVQQLKSTVHVLPSPSFVIKTEGVSDKSMLYNIPS